MLVLSEEEGKIRMSGTREGVGAGIAETASIADSDAQCSAPPLPDSKFAGPCAQGVLDPVIIPCPMSPGCAGLF